MNSKMIAIIAVVAMCGAALVGVGYAYSASYETSNSASADVNYITIDLKDGDDSISAPMAFKADVKYDTQNTPTTKKIKVASLDPQSGSYLTKTLSVEVKQEGVNASTFTPDVKMEIKNITVTNIPVGVKLFYQIQDSDKKYITDNTAVTVSSYDTNKSITFGLEIDSTYADYVEGTLPTADLSVTFDVVFSIDTGSS